MNAHRTRPIIVWLAALAILWGLLRPSLNAFTASSVGKALVEGGYDAGAGLRSLYGADDVKAFGRTESAAHAALAVAAWVTAKVRPARVAQATHRFAEPSLAPANPARSSHPSRAPPVPA
jgi:hypothetical protein